MHDNEGGALSRRQLVGGVGVGIAAAAGPALAQPQIQPTSSEPVMDDPRSKYPKPPFKKQTQPWPGLARDMDPRPDHGETSYRGSGRLSGRKARKELGRAGREDLKQNFAVLAIKPSKRPTVLLTVRW